MCGRGSCLEIIIKIIIVITNNFVTVKALKDGIPITTPSFYMSETSLTDDVIRHVFRSATKEEMPLLSERIRIIREAGKVLFEVR